MNRFDIVTVTLLLLVSVCCLFEFSLHGHVNLVREYETACLSLRWMLLLCLVVWCGVLIFLHVKTGLAADWFLVACYLLLSFTSLPKIQALMFCCWYSAQHWAEEPNSF